MMAPVVEPLVEAVEAVELGPVEQCGVVERLIPSGVEVECPHPADYVLRSVCGDGHDVRTPLCLEHVDHAAAEVGAGRARCDLHPWFRVHLLDVRPIGV